MPISDERKRRRASFDEHAASYDSVRPSYPDAVFDGVAELARLRQGARIVEIGCGTGQATVPLARRGYWMTCVELGGELAAIAHGGTSRRFRTSRWSTRARVLGAAATRVRRGRLVQGLRLVRPRDRLPQVRRAPTAGRCAAIVTNRPVLANGADPFLGEVRADYVAVGADVNATGAPDPDDVVDRRTVLEATGLFASVDVRRLLWELTFDADGFAALISTYSAHRALADDVRERLLERIRVRIDARPQRRVRITYVALLGVGRT
jgi:SAM-dependent methyltransferase